MWIKSLTVQVRRSKSWDCSSPFLVVNVEITNCTYTVGKRFSGRWWFAKAHWMVLCYLAHFYLFFYCLGLKPCNVAADPGVIQVTNVNIILAFNAEIVSVKVIKSVKCIGANTIWIGNQMTMLWQGTQNCSHINTLSSWVISMVHIRASIHIEFLLGKTLKN